MKRSEKIWIALGIFVLIILIVAIYFTFFFSYKCADLSCFQAHQEKCSKTRFVYDTPEMTWKYFILGKEGRNCEIKVTALQVKLGAVDKAKLEGKTMNCFLPLGDLSLPETDISRCHGLLKEELQDMIIQKLHQYIVGSVGQIAEELEKPLG